MKNILIAVLFILLVGVSIYGLFQRSSVNDRTKAAIIAEQDRDNAREAKVKAEGQLKQVRDSLEKMLTIAMNFKIDTRKAEIKAQQIQKRYETEKANFVIHSSDSVRLHQLAKYFPSVLSR